MSRILAPRPDPNRYVVMNRSAGNDSDIVLATSERRPRPVGGEPGAPGRRRGIPDQQQTQMSEVTIGSQDLPAVVVGSVVEVPNAGYDLYFIYPMEQEVATMDLIGNSFLVAGLILTLLVGAALVVTRQVVTPVRRAGRRPAAVGRQAQRADAGARRGRPRPPRHVVQRDGRQPPVPDPPARGPRRCSSASSPTSPTSCAPR